MKDGCGMIGGLIFSYYSSAYFDSHVKEFRLFADIINDIGQALDMIAPHIPKSYLIYISIGATLCRTLCGISAGATKGSITQHFAIESNMADLNAKEGTQETLVSLIGMVVGIILARMIQSMDEQCQIVKSRVNLIGNADDSSAISTFFYVHSAFLATWFIFIAFTWVHVWANYVGVKKLRLKTLNRQRAKVVFGQMINEIGILLNDDMMNPKSDVHLLRRKVLDIRDNNIIISPLTCEESLFRSVREMIMPGKMRLGVKLKGSLHGLCDEESYYLADSLFRNERYLISINGFGSMSRINVVLHVEADGEDKLKAFVHALIIEDCLRRKICVSENKARMNLITR